MKLRYIKSSTVVIESNDVKILSDPWLIDGEYYGSWYHYPPLEINQEFINSIDYIYVSHIHPDHFSKKTFEILDKTIPILIHDYSSKFLKMNLERLGFKVTELQQNKRTHLKNGVYINILAADNCNPELCARFMGCGIVETKFGSTQIDTMCVIDNGEYTILNTNDCPYDLAIDTLKEIKKSYTKVDILLTGYAGAGPYPQCFKIDENTLTNAIEQKKLQFLNQGVSYINFLNPNNVLPFAGTYVLGGFLAKLNSFRGVPEIEEAAKYFQSKTSANILLLNSYEYFDLASNSYSNNYKPTNLEEKENYIANVLSQKKLDYEQENPLTILTNDEFYVLLDKAYIRFESKRKEINFISDTKILINLENNMFCSISCKGEGYSIINSKEKENIKQFVGYRLHKNLLILILKGPRFAHWDNAEIGSHIEFNRQPNIFERGLYHCLCFFHS
jgi:UDP-MurNAc hydroxylase